MNTEEKIEASGKKKEEGNALFKAGKYVRASKRYEKVKLLEVANTDTIILCFSVQEILTCILFCTQAAKYIEYDSSFSDEEKKQCKVLKVSCNLNNAACKLKLKEYKEAEKLCTKVFLCYIYHDLMIEYLYIGCLTCNITYFRYWNWKV